MTLLLKCCEQAFSDHSPGQKLSSRLSQGGIVRYERRNQDHTPEPNRTLLCNFAGQHFRPQEEKPWACQLRPANAERNAHAWRTLPHRPLCPGLGSSAESDRGDLACARHDSLRL